MKIKKINFLFNMGIVFVSVIFGIFWINNANAQSSYWKNYFSQEERRAVQKNAQKYTLSQIESKSEKWKGLIRSFNIKNGTIEDKDIKDNGISTDKISGLGDYIDEKISGSSTPQDFSASNLTGTYAALDGSQITNLNPANITGSGNLNIGNGDLFVDDTSGNVGVGTVLPNASLDVDGNILLNGNIGTNEGTHNLIMGNVFESDASYNYNNVIGENIGNSSTGGSHENSIIGYSIANSSLFPMVENTITGHNIASAAFGVGANTITGENIANFAGVSVLENAITGKNIANASTTNVYHNVIAGESIANSATMNVYDNTIAGSNIANHALVSVTRNTISGYNIANSATGYVYYNAMTGDGIANSATGDVSHNAFIGENIANTAVGNIENSFSVGDYNIYNTTNATDLNRVIALPYESLRESSASDLTDAIAIGYRAGYLNQYNSPMLLGRESAAGEDNQIVIGSNFYTGGTALMGGNIGIGTTAPVVALDVDGQIKMKKESAQPFACDAAHDGTIALTSGYRTCVCKGGSTSWVFTTDGTTACTW